MLVVVLPTAQKKFCIENNSIACISDALILNPWDREIVRDGRFVLHPEYVFALEKQGIVPTESLLLGREPAQLAKG